MNQNEYTRETRAMLDRSIASMHHIASLIEASQEIECEYDASADLFVFADLVCVPYQDVDYIIRNNVPASEVIRFADYKGEANFRSWHKLFTTCKN